MHSIIVPLCHAHFTLLCSFEGGVGSSKSHLKKFLNSALQKDINKVNS